MNWGEGACHAWRTREGSPRGPAAVSAPPGLGLTFSGSSPGPPGPTAPQPHSQASGQTPRPAASCAQTKRALSSGHRPRRAPRPAQHRRQARPLPAPPCLFVRPPCLPPFLRPGRMDTGESPSPGHTQWSCVCGSGLWDHTESRGETGRGGRGKKDWSWSNSNIPS